MTHPPHLVPRLFAVSLFLALLIAIGCGSENDANPVSPSNSGSSSGGSMTAPSPLEPANGVELSTGQPIRFLFANASSSGAGALSYRIEVALDAEFASRVASADDVQQGASGQSSYTLTQALNANRYYYWRARATDGANAGPYSAPANFRLVDPVSLEAPAPVSPVNGETIDSTTPTLVARNTAISGAAGAITYRFEVSLNGAFTQVIAVWSASRSGGETTSVTGTPLTAGTEHFWRVQASDGSAGSLYSTPQSFRTPGGAPGGGGGGGGGGGTPPSSGWPTTGEAIVAWATQSYPDRLAPTTAARRKVNMEFLRDRMIEAGLCGGMQLGWNLKRGGPELSTDYLAHVRNGQTHGVDIAFDYDNAGTAMRLTWADKGTDDGAVYATYGNALPCR